MSQPDYKNLTPLDAFCRCPACGGAKLAKTRINLECADCGFIFFFNPVAAVIGIVADGGRVLFTRRARDPARGLLDLPGGFVDFGETAEDALRRELREELGAEVSELRYFGTFYNSYRYRDVTYRTLDIAFECAVPDVSRLVPCDDVSAVELRAPRDLDPAEIGLDSIRAVLRQYLERRG